MLQILEIGTGACDPELKSFLEDKCFQFFGHRAKWSPFYSLALSFISLFLIGLTAIVQQHCTGHPPLFVFSLGLMQFRPIKGWKSVCVFQLWSQLKSWPTSLPPAACISRAGRAVWASSVYKLSHWVIQVWTTENALQLGLQTATAEESGGQKLLKMALQLKTDWIIL